MHRNILWQICHKKSAENSELTVIIIGLLRKNGLTTKEIARELNIPTERVRNWFYKKTGMTALDFVKLMAHYESVKHTVLGLIVHK